MIYVIEGNGTLTKKDETIHFEKGEIYFWDANCRIVMPCTPAWYPKQHKLIEE
ncbi:MAG: cupin domain-containing protein [Clostridia bacterium]|jgi:mannose-6-phosphate isomerase-like protein (cupin superfamily)|nr:cupin domain-containing protein [Clostridia bacterium]